MLAARGFEWCYSSAQDVAFIAKSVRASLAFYHFASNIVSYEMSQVVILSKIANTWAMWN